MSKEPTPPADLVEGNKIIAEFMGWHWSDVHGWLPDGKRDSWDFNSELKYHSSWDWLMPVIEKIFEQRYPDYYGPTGKTDDDSPYDDFPYIRTFGMRDDEGLYMVRINANAVHRGETLIKATWLAVVDFIQWYNNQKLKP